MNKKGKLFILSWVFSYGSASSNRLLAYAKSASDKGFNVEIISLLRIELNAYLPADGIIIRGLSPCRINSKPLAILISFFTTIFFLFFTISKKDKILLYGSSEYLPLCLLFRRSQLWFEVTECPDLFHPKNYPFFIYKWFWKRLKGIFVISKNLKEYFENSRIKPERVHVVNMIVDPSRFEGLKRNPSSEKYIAYCGNVNKDSKDGVDDLIHAFTLYHQTFPDRKLYIVGPIVSEEQKEKYVEYLKLSRLESSVVFTGSISPEEIPSILMNAEMLVLARPYNIQAKYGFPTKLGEYLLSGRPNVITDVGNITDFLKDGENVYIANPGDIASIASKMKDVSSDLQKAKNVGLSGKECAIINFNNEIETEKILNIMFES